MKPSRKMQDPATHMNAARPIVCGTDFSKNAARAAEAGAAIAKRLNSTLILVRSVDERGEFPDELRGRIMEELRPRLEQEVTRLREHCSSVEGKVLAGIHYLGSGPDDGLVNFAVNAGARLVVMASPSTDVPGRWVLGSVAERTAETSPVPTLVVRSAAPFVAWARGERALKVFVATDFAATSDAALRWVAELRQVGPCEITLGYIDQTPGERSELAMFESAQMVVEQRQTRQTLQRDLRQKARRLLGTAPAVRVEPASAPVDVHLIDLSTAAGADILVLGTHQWRGIKQLRHGSISRRILHDAPMSVACVPVPPSRRAGQPRSRN